MAGSESFEALTAMKLKIEKEKMELAEMQNLLRVRRERTAAVNKETAELEVYTEKLKQDTARINARRAARAAEMAKLKNHYHNEQLPRLEALRKRLKKRLEMKEKQREAYERQQAAFEEAIRKQEEYYKSHPKIARRDELRKRKAWVQEQIKIKTEEVARNKALLAERRKRNKEKWDAFVKICIQAATNWKAGQEAERLKKLEEEKRIQRLLTRSKAVVKPVAVQNQKAGGSCALAVSREKNDLTLMMSRLLGKRTPPPSTPKITARSEPKFQELWADFNKKLGVNVKPQKHTSPANKGRPSFLDTSTVSKHHLEISPVKKTAESFARQCLAASLSSWSPLKSGTSAPSIDPSQTIDGAEDLISKEPEISPVRKTAQDFSRKCSLAPNLPPRTPLQSAAPAPAVDDDQTNNGADDSVFEELEHDEPSTEENRPLPDNESACEPQNDWEQCSGASDGFEMPEVVQVEMDSPARPGKTPTKRSPLIRSGLEMPEVSQAKMYSPAKPGKTPTKNLSPVCTGFRSPEVTQVGTYSPARPAKTPMKNFSPVRSLLASVDTEDIAPPAFFKVPLPVQEFQRQENSPATSSSTADLASQSTLSSQQSSVSDSPRKDRFVSFSDSSPSYPNRSLSLNFSPSSSGRFPSFSDRSPSVPSSSSSFADPQINSVEATSGPSEYDFFSGGASSANSPPGGGMDGFNLNFGDESESEGFNLGLDNETFSFDQDDNGGGGDGAFF